MAALRLACGRWPIVRYFAYKTSGEFNAQGRKFAMSTAGQDTLKTRRSLNAAGKSYY
jgi:hypothetical protein